MRLSAKHAQKIIAEIRDIIDYDVDFIDRDGYIIASTTEKHVGNFHAIAKKIIDQNLQEVYITPQEASGIICAGLNLAVYCDKKAVGVVGISGVSEQSFKYGRIVKKMTELLIRELDEEKLKQQQSRMRERFLEEWILEESKEPKEVLAERGLAVGIDVTAPYRVMVVSPSLQQKFVERAALQKMLEKLEKLKNTVLPDSMLLRHAGRDILILKKCSDREMLKSGEYLQNLAQRAYGLELVIGVDGNAEDIHISYLQADKAWRSTRFSGNNSVCLYSDLSMELFVVEIPEKAKEDYIHKIFPGCKYDELKSWMEILEVYFSVDGSLQKGAELLHMHKNTLQYKIKKLEELTGCDVRKPGYAALLFMAWVFFVDQKSSLALVDSENL